jgi:hypothetical protein
MQHEQRAYPCLCVWCRFGSMFVCHEPTLAARLCLSRLPQLIHISHLTLACAAAVVEFASALVANWGIGGIQMQRVQAMMCQDAAGSMFWNKMWVTHLWSKVCEACAVLRCRHATMRDDSDQCVYSQYVVTPSLYARQLQPEYQLALDALQAMQRQFKMTDPGTGKEMQLIRGTR